MSRFLLVGDPHVVPDEIGDSLALMEYVLKVAKENDNPTIVLLGDQHHTHAVIRLEVMAFWRKIFNAIDDHGFKAIVMRGNHDGFVEPGEGDSVLDAYRDFENVEIVSYGPLLRDNVLFVPYCHTEKQFLELCNLSPEAGTVVCHQTFDGSTYENGFRAPDGYNLSLVPQKHVISGHIHTPQNVGKCEYIGAPRWRSIDDANISRSIALVRFNDAGEPASQMKFSTGNVCRQILHVIDTPEDPLPTDLDQKHRWHVDVVGPHEWVEERKVLFAPLARVRTRKTDARAPRVKESDGLEVSFMRFMAQYKSKNGTTTHVLREMVKDRMRIS